MEKNQNPKDFVTKAQKNRKLSERILLAVERGNKVTAEEILQIAQEFGYNFTQAQLEKELVKTVDQEVEAGSMEKMAAVKKKPKPKPPQSSCAKGCVSWTTNWHPVLE